MVLDRLWYRRDFVVRGCSARPAVRQSSVISGKVQAGGELYMFLFDWSALMDHPQEGSVGDP
jgi:hypothetical protein